MKVGNQLPLSHVPASAPVQAPIAATVDAPRADKAPPVDGADHKGQLFADDARRPAPVTSKKKAVPAEGIEKVFAKVVGPAAIAALKASFSTKPVVLIAGDQLTGKSTAAKTVAQAMGGEGSGTGRLMRDAAAKAGKPVEEFVKSVPASFDVELDWQAAKKIAKGDVAVFESRLAGHLGQMLERLGRENVLSVYLVASPRERALRYLNRELSPEVRQRIEPKLDIKADATLEEALAAVVALDDPDASKIAASMKDIAHRDDVDLARLQSLYGVNYQDRAAFDVVVVTDGKTPQQVQDEILAAVKRLSPQGG
jgi:cytidylate kinase